MMYADDRTAKELRRLARRLERGARNNETLAKSCEERGAQAARAFADGSAFAFRHSAKILKAAARGENL